MVPDGGRGLLLLRARDPGQVDRADRPGAECSGRGRRRRDHQASLKEAGMTAISADLAGDQDVIARAEAISAAVAAASNDIETTRRLPPDLLDRLHEAQLFR